MLSSDGEPRAHVAAIDKKTSPRALNDAACSPITRLSRRRCAITRTTADVAHTHRCAGRTAETKRTDTRVLFNSLAFVGFFLVVYSLYAILRHRAQTVLLLVASYGFYGCRAWRFLSLIFLPMALVHVPAASLDRAGHIELALIELDIRLLLTDTMRDDDDDLSLLYAMGVPSDRRAGAARRRRG